MINSEESFNAIESMIQSEGWKLFSSYLQTKGNNAMNSALGESNDRERSRHLDTYKAYRKILEDVYGIYKAEYERYKKD